MDWVEKCRIARMWAAYKILNCGKAKFADFGLSDEDTNAVIKILEDLSVILKPVESLDEKIKLLFN